jgi:hypothetical protein
MYYFLHYFNMLCFICAVLRGCTHSHIEHKVYIMKTFLCEVYNRIKIEICSYVNDGEIYNLYYFNLNRILSKIIEKFCLLKLDCEVLCTFQTIKEKDVLLIYCNFLYVKSGKHKFTCVYTVHVYSQALGK